MSCSKESDGAISRQTDTQQSTDRDPFGSWKHSPPQSRHKHLDQVLGPNWSLNPDKRIKNIKSTALSGLNKREVIELLGEPDHTTHEAIIYEVGYVEQPSIDKRMLGEIVPGLGVQQDSLITYFSHDNGIVDLISLSN